MPPAAEAEHENFLVIIIHILSAARPKIFTDVDGNTFIRCKLQVMSHEQVSIISNSRVVLVSK
jgi:hypothetical protein